MADPTLPSATVDTTMPDVTGYTTVTVPGTYATLQAAIDAVTLSTIISLTAATEYSEVPLTLKNKATGSGWIIIETAGARASAWLPTTGTRLDGPNKRSNMARIVRPVSASGVNLALTCANGAHHYRFIGIEFQNAGNTETGFNAGGYLVHLDNLSGTIAADQPHHMILDRCYVHGPGTAQSVSVRFGVMLGGSNMALIDSYIDDVIDHDGDAIGIGGYNGNGPYKIVNNYIASSGENLLFGGADPYVVSDIATDVTIQKNYFYKKLKWRDDATYTGGALPVHAKNLFEIKCGKRWLIEGNVLENHWADSQLGYAVLFSPLAGGIDTAATAYTTIQDITFRKNKFSNVSSGMWLRGGGVGSYFPEGPSVQGGRWLIEDNFFYNLGDPANWPLATGGFPCNVFTILEGPYDLQIKNNTVVYASTITNVPFYFNYDSGGTTAQRQTMTRFVLKNNIFHAGPTSYMAFVTAFTAGTDWLAPAAPSYDASYNLVIGPWPTGDGSTALYPILFPLAANPNWYTGTSITEAGYTNAAGGDYSLTALSTYHHAGSDGTDIGVDWGALQTAIAGSVSGAWTTPLYLPFRWP